MLVLTFDKEWIDNYWLDVDPKVISSITNFEKHEYWVVGDDSEALSELNRVAERLPEIANIPFSYDERVEEHAFRLLKILAYLPLKTSIAAFGWLGALSEAPHKWNMIVNVYANKIIANTEAINTDMYSYSRILISRVNLFSFLTEFEKHFLSDEAMRFALKTHKDQFNGGKRDGK